MGKPKCENCDNLAKKCLLEIWIPLKKSWGTEWASKKVCPTCWEAIVSEDEGSISEYTGKVYLLTKEQRDYICAQCCNYKDCLSDCPVFEVKDNYELDEVDVEEICSHCKRQLSGCDLKCPIRKEENHLQQS